MLNPSCSEGLAAAQSNIFNLLETRNCREAHYQSDAEKKKIEAKLPCFGRFLTAQCDYVALIKIKSFFYNEHMDSESA